MVDEKWLNVIHFLHCHQKTFFQKTFMDNHIRKNHMRSYSNKKFKHFKFTFNRIKKSTKLTKKNHDQSSHTMENTLKRN